MGAQMAGMMAVAALEAGYLARAFQKQRRKRWDLACRAVLVSCGRTGSQILDCITRHMDNAPAHAQHGAKGLLPARVQEGA